MITTNQQEATSNYAINCVWSIPGLSIPQTLILVALANKANNKNICWPSVATLSSETNISRRSIWANIKKLESRKLISRNLNFERNSNTYFLDFADNKSKETVETQTTNAQKMVNNKQKLSTITALGGYPGGAHPPMQEVHTPYAGGAHKPTENHQFESSEKQEEKSLPVDNFLLTRKPSPEIGDILSKEQENEILVSLNNFKKNIGGFCEVPTLEEVCYVILDKNSFKAAGNDFAWKLNSINKCIRNGNFKPPVELQAKKHEEAKIIKNEEQRKINEAKQAIRDAISSRDNYELLINKTSHLGEQHVSKLCEERDKINLAIPGLKLRLREVLGRSNGVAYG